MERFDSSIGMEAVRATCESVLREHDLELVELYLTRDRGRQVLRVTLDRLPGARQGVTLDEITGVSEEISRALDYDDPIPGSYMLEVASAGLERPLVKASDYERFAGREIKVTTSESLEGKRNFQGTIRAAGLETFVLAGETEVVEIPYSSVARAKLVVDWDAEFRRAQGEN